MTCTKFKRISLHILIKRKNLHFQFETIFLQFLQKFVEMEHLQNLGKYPKT